MNDKNDKNDKLIIPKTVKVGFQKRTDTYSGRLAYVVYIDSKGVLRKEKSWEGWRDKNITPEEFSNEPTYGFVLNKDVGGVQRSWSWNARREKVRVYDPRNFEFEISVENLLFILQECSSIKGKGLEGAFVYSWAGTELVLLPVDSHEYRSSFEFTNLQVEKVSAKDVKEGFSYLTKDKKEVMYLGKFTWWEKKYLRSSVDYTTIIKGDKKHVFIYMSNIDEDENGNGNVHKIGKSNYLLTTGFTGIAKRTSENPLPQFAHEFEKLSKSHYVSKPVNVYLSDKDIFIKEGWQNDTGIMKDGVIYSGSYSKNWQYNKGEVETYQIDYSNRVELKDNNVVITSTRRSVNSGWGCGGNRYTYEGIIEDKVTKEELVALAKKIVIEHENGAKSSLNS